MGIEDKIIQQYALLLQEKNKFNIPHGTKKEYAKVEANIQRQETDLLNNVVTLLKKDYKLPCAEIKTSLSNGIEKPFIRIAYWQQLPEKALNDLFINELLVESILEDDDTLPRYSYHIKY